MPQDRITVSARLVIPEDRSRRLPASRERQPSGTGQDDDSEDDPAHRAGGGMRRELRSFHLLDCSAPAAVRRPPVPPEGRRLSFPGGEAPP